MNKLRVRAYNVLFGDAFLISFPERDSEGRTEMRHILVDVGNSFRGKGSQDTVFQPVIADILQVLAGQPLDLYVMTHEHMDHVQGLFYAKEHGYADLRERLRTRFAWLTASAAPDYYTRHEDARKRKLAFEGAYQRAAGYVSAIGLAAASPMIQAVLWNNNPQSTADCVDYLRKLADRTSYVYRGYELKKGEDHDFSEARFEIWAPEEDTTTYYTSLRSMALGVDDAGKGPGRPSPIRVAPPPGVDVTAFYDLVAQREGYGENLLAIDKANNNTSIVFCMEWRGWRLLFPGDAEELSWQRMDQVASGSVLKAVDFLKVSHHGSFNGTPGGELLEKILPKKPARGRRRKALLSTAPEQYDTVPDQSTVDEIRARCQLYDTQTIAQAAYLDITFTG